jgi:hypothetical protein
VKGKNTLAEAIQMKKGRKKIYAAPIGVRLTEPEKEWAAEEAYRLRTSTSSLLRKFLRYGLAAYRENPSVIEAVK